MKDLIQKLEVKDFEFKEPWRSSDRSLAVVVPIVANKYGERAYVVIDEVEDQVTLVDTGAIGATKVDNKSNKSVFIRGGTMLKGGTQERAFQYGVVIAPAKEEEIPVKCIHASRGIRAGASLSAKGLVPRAVGLGLRSQDRQHVVWESISSYHMSATRSPETYALSDAGAHALAAIDSDDLVQVEEVIHKFSESLKKILESIPDYKDQVGVVILDPNGLAGMELYDHPQSWDVFSKAIVKSYSDVLAKEGKIELFIPNVEVAIDTINAFLDTLMKEATEEEVYNQNEARTVIVKADKYVGEYTSLKGSTIHFSVARGD